MYLYLLLKCFFFVNSDHLDEQKGLINTMFLGGTKNNLLPSLSARLVHALIYSAILYVLAILFDDASPLSTGN
jgi:hypothetical protein